MSKEPVYVCELEEGDVTYLGTVKSIVRYVTPSKEERTRVYFTDGTVQSFKSQTIVLVIEE